MPDNQEKVIFTPKVEEEGKIDELPVNPDEISMPAVNEKMSPEELEAAKADLEKTLKELDAEELNKKNYYKVTPTFYVKAIESEDEEEELFKILNPETNVVETRELTDDEKKELLVKQLKESRTNFHPIKQDGNITTNKYGSKFKATRKRKNKAAKSSRRKNRK